MGPLGYADGLQTASPLSLPVPTPLAPRNTRGGRWLAAGGLAAWALLWNRLRVDWTVNDQYSYGWFVPPLALAVGFLRWKDRPAPVPPGARTRLLLALLAGACLLGLFPLRLLEEPNGDWRLLSWLHAGLLTTLTLAAMGWCGGRPWARHFLFPVGFLLLAVPWPSGPEQALVQSLQRHVAAVAAELMNLLGIPARQEGNLIRVRDQLVGVNEACSGIRSLQTVLMAGLFLGELSRFTIPRRAALLAGGVVVAMAANVFRSSLLVWLAADYGADSLARYHDLAGVSVLVIVFVGLLILNGRLEGKPPSGERAVSPAPPAGAAVDFPPVAASLLILGWLALTEAGTEGWYRWHERGRTERPLWTISLPEKAPRFQRVKVDEVSRSLLRYDEGLEARWRDPGPTAADCTAFFFRWEPGRTSTTLAVMHQPTTCLPSSGLRQVHDFGVEPVPVPGGFTLPVHAYEFSLRGRPLHVFYVVWQDRTGYELPAPATVASEDRLSAVRLGQRNLGQQTLELVISGAPDAAAARTLAVDTLQSIIRPRP